VEDGNRLVDQPHRYGPDRLALYRGLTALPRVAIDASRGVVATQFRKIISGEADGQPQWVKDLASGDDEGFFGPGSATWAVHGALPTLVGGVRSLLMQTLHPAALAGVQQHSAYEQDPLGRLARTTEWLTITTFGDRESATRASDRVRGLHRKVVGEYSDGKSQVPYSAMDPTLLNWVHIAFTDSFLRTNLVWGGPIPGGPDQYVREWAKAGELVGVTDPPRSVAELEEQLDSYRPILRSDAATATTLSFIRNPPLPLIARPSYQLLLAGAISTLDRRERRLTKLPSAPLAVTKPPVAAMLGGMKFALGPQAPSARNAHDRLR